MTESKKDSKTLYKKISTLIIAFVMILTIIACLYLFIQVIGGKKPNLFGYRFYYILTDSMTPELQVDDVILARTINTIEEAKQINKGDVVTFIAEEGYQKGLTITHKVIKEPHFDEVINKTVIITMGTKFGATPDPPVPLENVQAVMVKKLGFIGALYRFVTSFYGMICIVLIPMSLIISILVVRLVKTIKKPAEEDKQLTPEEIERKAVEEYKEKERLEQEIAQKAVEEYINKYEKKK